MTKLIAILAATLALGACSSMYGSGSMGNTSETKNSTDSQAMKAGGNGAAVSPGGGGSK